VLKVSRTDIPDVLIVEPRLFEDERGFFLESWNARELCRAVGFEVRFVQDCHSRSRRGVLRGMHYQISRPQGKLVRVVRGHVFDVSVDLRASSPTFGRWVGVELSERDHRQVWIPPGFAHGFLVLSESADFMYKATDDYAPEDERCLIWNDPEVGIGWPLRREPLLAAKDKLGLGLRQAETFA
jgi:dTDP-4-dehydrorhamnose 3,5-epimerase